MKRELLTALLSLFLVGLAAKKNICVYEFPTTGPKTLEEQLAIRKYWVPENIIDENFVLSVIQVESNGKPNARSPKNAKGLMQLMPTTWTHMTGNKNYADAYDSKKNREVGTKYLKWIEKYCAKECPWWEILFKEQKQKLIAAAYHGGSARLKGRNWDPSSMPKQTRHYILKLYKVEAFNQEE